MHPSLVFGRVGRGTPVKPERSAFLYRVIIYDPKRPRTLAMLMITSAGCIPAASVCGECACGCLKLRDRTRSNADQSELSPGTATMFFGPVEFKRYTGGWDLL